MIANCRGFSLEFVNPVLHILCPLCGRLAVIESLPGNRLADGDAEMLAHILVHLIHEEHHGKVERQMLVAESGDAIESLGVLTTEMDRHHITLVFHALGDESLLPRQIADAAIRLLAAVQSRREHQHVVVTLESSLYHAREVTALSAGLIDTDAHRLQAREIEQQIVYQIAELTIVMRSDDGAEAHAVLSTQRMIRHESIELAIILIRQILQAYDFYIHFQIAHTFCKPLRTGEVSAFPQELVHLVFVYDLFQPRHEESRNKFSFAPHLILQYLFYVYRFLY